MKETFDKIEHESLASPERIDGRSWLRQIFRESEPRLLYKLEDAEKIGKLRKTISTTEVVFVEREEQIISAEKMIQNTRLQKYKDISIACPKEAVGFINEERKKDGRNRTKV